MKKIDDYLDFLLQEKGEDILFKGQNKKALISDEKDKINFYDDKFIRTDFEIKTGDVIDYQNSTWLIISEVDRNRLSHKARMRRSNYKIKMVVDEALCEFDTIIEGISFGIDEGKFMSFEDGKIEVTVPADTVSNKIDTDMRFIKMDKAWRIVGVDKSRLRLNILHCEKDSFGTNDDKENEIADKNKIAVWEIKINEDNRQISIDKDFIFTATVKKNGIEVPDQVIIWESSNESIANVNNGAVDGIAVGNVIIAVFIKDKPMIKSSIDVEIIESLPDVITYKTWCAYEDGSEKTYDTFEIYSGMLMLFGIDKYINGVIADKNDTYIFRIDPKNTPTNKYSMTIINEDTVKIEAKGYTYYIDLVGTSNETGEETRQEIKLKSIF